MQHQIDLTSVRKQQAHDLGSHFRGMDPDGHTIGFTSCSMTYDQEPFFAVCGEMHFCRVNPDQWSDSIMKMKAGGINILSTYVFWNVHEEKEGQFRFDGYRDIRTFLELCRRHHMWVILRIGPFAHGEMRNGGMPDWLYGKPFDIRSNDPAYLACVRRLYEQIHGQVDGMYFGQGGPVVGIQLENEYMHSAAPWEITNGCTAEWISTGDGGEEHIRMLKQIALDIGMKVPFYTATAWGGAMAPTDEVLPLWGGYAYRPWIFYRQSGIHPATEEYVYRNNHNNAVPSTYNFAPRYQPEDMPYACCEMMGGMFCSYVYRFVLPYESIDAMANIKLGSGCSMLGYYMYRGGTTPAGDTTPFMNEGQVTKKSYDFQAPVGEFGQLRPSWFRLRTVHEFCRSYAEILSECVTMLPPHAAEEPTDTASLRWCVRTNRKQGFIFVNNFQDHLELPDRQHEEITLNLPDETISVPAFDISSGENAVLPFNLQIGPVLLKCATAQPITQLEINGETCAFFVAPEGTKPVFQFSKSNVEQIVGCEQDEKEGTMICLPSVDDSFVVKTPQKALRFFVLSRSNANRFSHARLNGKEVAILSDAPVLEDDTDWKLEVSHQPLKIMTYPPVLDAEAIRSANSSLTIHPASFGLFAGITIENGSTPAELPVLRTGSGRYTLSVPAAILDRHKSVLANVRYFGDIGQAFLNGRMVSDNFFNGTPWTIRVDSLKNELRVTPLTLVIVPVKEGRQVQSQTTMAGRSETASAVRETIEQVTLTTIDEIILNTIR